MLLSCPACQRQLNIPDSAAGQQVRCPLCQAVFAVPSASPVSVAPQPPPAPQPPAYDPAPRAPARHDPYAGQGAAGPAQEFGFEEGRGRGGRSQYSLTRGAANLTGAAIVFTVAVVLDLLLDLIAVGMVGAPLSFFAGALLLRFLIIVFIAGAPIVFMFIGSGMLRRARGRGIVLTAGILAIVLAGIATLYLLLQLIALGAVGRLGHGGIFMVLILRMVVIGAATVYGFIAGISTLTLLGRPAVQEAFAANEQRWGGPRREEYDDRRGRPDDQRW